MLIFSVTGQIGDDGVAALASALRGGALPACTWINLDGNPGSAAPVDEALERKGASMLVTGYVCSIK
jgi:hypothetical protein